MRYVDLDVVTKHIFAGPDGSKNRQRLLKAHRTVTKKAPDQRQQYIRANGTKKWKPIKDQLTALLGKKCWYTEVEIIGAPLTIDHYRPVCNYWWLAFDVGNYRVASPFANSPEHNAEHGCAGGKGDEFPLLPPGLRARGKSNLRIEKPIILDPCNQADCDLLVFHTDGRPILNPNFLNDPISAQRVDDSKILLNIDHPDFNSKREQLYQKIAKDVRDHEDPTGSASEKQRIIERLRNRISAKAPFSTAARIYLGSFRFHDWVEDLLNPP